MTVWQKQSQPYKVGFIGVVAGALLFVVGFCTPSWVSFTGMGISQSMGLWQICTIDLSVCTMSVSSDNPGFLKAVRALECISMFFAVAACIVGLYSNFILKTRLATDFFNKNMETSAVVSVIFGSFGLVIFATQIHSYHSNMMNNVSWGFILVCVATTLLGLGAFLMLISHKIRLIALQDRFAHRHLENSFHTQVDFPDYVSEGCDRHAYISPYEYDSHMDYGPPAYETVVNCIPQDEVAPPPYAEVAKLPE
ncbi:uncharacterized protein LOC101852804 [Aplysia californica]|uniref:Uncharacterized protein LOC101852804 n=1 Tax=Aplysia californica TaxID=6500 RepID=A0ABM0K6P0_APLCA|nr:uncharacterized protein LOC101852804 [Aplysia californica]